MGSSIHAENSSAGSTNKKSVLLVEDNSLNQKLIGFMLKKHGMEEESCGNGAIAIELLRKKRFDLVLMDVEMPVMNGYESTHFIRHELGLRVPIIALTAHTNEEERRKCLDAGMNDFLSKPVDEKELWNKIRKHLNLSA
jgi:CheY-like chemotaxis protein